MRNSSALRQALRRLVKALARRQDRTREQETGQAVRKWDDRSVEEGELMAVTLPAGKLRNLMTLADANGRLKMMAIDQRMSMERSLRQILGRPGRARAREQEAAAAPAN